MSNDTELQYCNWTFWDCLKQSNKWFVRIIDGEGRNATLDNWYYTRTYIGAKLLVILHNARNRSNQ